MEKNISMGGESREAPPEFKKIQDYIYKFNDQIGMGNFSKVFKGINHLTNKPVAIKIIELSSLNTARVQELLNTETKILKMISHPNVIGCQEILSSVRNCYIVMQLCNGGDLEKRLRKCGDIKQKDLMPIAVDVLEGLKYLAKHHIVHRDIKASNIFIHNGVHKIADFGFAQISQVQFKDISVGSPIYMSPQGYINNLYGPKTDVWAFGVLLYELVQGKTPCSECRTEGDLKKHLMKQIDYSSFNSQISNELKKLIVQCLTISVSNRINVHEIQKSQWMKNAIRIVHDGKKNEQIAIEKQSQEQKSQKRSFLDTDFKFNLQSISNNASLNIHETPTSTAKNSFIKNYSHKFNNFLKTDDKQQRKRNHTLDKGNQKIAAFDNKDKLDNEATKIFYSPKNINSKFQKIIGSLGSQTPHHKFQSLHFKSNFKNDESSTLKLSNTIKNNLNNNTFDHKKEQLNNSKQESKNISHKNSWLQKSPSLNVKDFKILNQNFVNRDKTSAIYTNELKSSKQQIKKNNEQKNSFINNNIGVSTPSQNGFQKQNLKFSDQTKERQRFSQFVQTRVFKYNNNKQNTKQDAPEQKIQLKTMNNQKQSPMRKTQFINIINRTLKFGDCIGIIHYCRLCYKFASLLGDCGEAEENRWFFMNWSVSLLQELSNHIKNQNVEFNNENYLINNPSLTKGQIDKKKKLIDVTDEYLNKYLISIKKHHKVQFFGLKEASNFIYNMYIQKGHQFKQKAKQKKQHMYYALLSYLSALDRETRNLMQFVFQIKSFFDAKFVEKILSIKISEFTKKTIQDIAKQNSQNTFQI